MMKFSIIGGGAWGSTLAQVLIDNGHKVMIYEKNLTNRTKLENGYHPFFKNELPKGYHVVSSFEEAMNYSDYIVLAVPSRFIIDIINSLKQIDVSKKVFINVSKGFILPKMKTVSQSFNEYLNEKYKAFISLSGPSHAEEVIERKMTCLVCSSKNKKEVDIVSSAFTNNYLNISKSSDIIGCEVGGATKNAIAVTSGIITSLGFGENARAALITLGLKEIKSISSFFKGKETTTYGLTGIGDLIVTALSMNSRNFKAGLNIGKGKSRIQIETEEKQTIEGFDIIFAINELTIKEQIKSPLINKTYELIYGKISLEDFKKTIFHNIK